MVSKKVRFLITLCISFTIFTNDAYADHHLLSVETTNDVNNFHFIDFRHYYYNQLNDIEKSIYDTLMNSKEKFLNNEDFTFPIQPYEKELKLGYEYYVPILRRAFKAFTYDNPEVSIWFDNYEKNYFHDNNYVYITLKSNNSTNSQNVRSKIIEFETIASNFVNTLSGTDVKKLKRIHDWLVDNCLYDYTLSLPDISNVYGPIVEKTSICSGFAYAYKYLADLANLNVLYVTGFFYDSEQNSFTPHAWNIVFANNEYFLVDVTFDTCSKTFDKNSYFLTSIDNLSHRIDSYYFDYSILK